MKRNYLFILLLLCLAFLCGCELFYDPAINGDVPSTQGLTWDKQTLSGESEFDPPFTKAELTGSMKVSQLLMMALYNNPSTRISWNTARAAGYGYYASLNEYFPAVAYTGTVTDQRTTLGSSLVGGSVIATNTGTSTATGTAIATVAGNSATVTYTMLNQIQISYLLFDFGGRNAQADFALQVLYGANWQHNLVVQQVILAVINAYTSYIGNEGLVKAFEQNLKDAEVAVDAAKKMHAAGLATQTDVYQALSTLEQTRLSLTQSQGAEKTSLAQLFFAVGLPVDTQITVEDLPQMLPVVEISGSVSGLIDLAKRKNPQIGIAIATINEQEANYNIAYSAGMPTFSSTGTYSQLHFFHNPKRDGSTESLSLQINYPIFQGFFYMNEQRQIKAQIQEALANYELQLSTVALNVASNYYTFTTAVASLPASEALLNYSERSYKGYLVQYRTGTSSILDLLNALTVLSNARAQQVIARTQWAASLANLAFAVGVLDDTSADWKEAPPPELLHPNEKDDNAKL